MTRLLKAVPIALLAALAVAVSGCGSTGTKASSSSESAAKLVRPGVVAFVSVNSDLESSQWKQLDELAKKFPGRDKALARIEQAFTKQGVDFKDDVEPALGPEVDLAVALGVGDRDPAVVALTKPDDPDKFKTLVAKLNASDSSGEKAVYREVDGWYALSDKQASIERVLASGGDSLANDATYQEALGQLSGETLVKAYVDGQQLNAAIRQTARKSGSPFGASALGGLEGVRYVAAAASAEDDGIRVHGAWNGGDLGGADFASKLLGGIPGDALALLDVDGSGTADQIEKLEGNPTFAEALKRFEASLGVPYDDVLDLIRNEIALYVRPGALIPEVTLVLEPNDAGRALSTLDMLAEHIAAMSGGKVETGTQDGREIKTVNFGQFAIHYGETGGKIVITSGVNGIADYGAPGEHVPDSADFKEAKAAAAMPDTTGGVVFIDIKDLVPLIQGFASLAGGNLPSDTFDNLRPLRSFLAWTEGTGDTRSFDAFLEIK
jgi:Protein of unknown function (DUF3352)